VCQRYVYNITTEKWGPQLLVGNTELGRKFPSKSSKVSRFCTDRPLSRTAKSEHSYTPIKAIKFTCTQSKYLKINLMQNTCEHTISRQSNCSRKIQPYPTVSMSDVRIQFKYTLHHAAMAHYLRVSTQNRVMAHPSSQRQPFKHGFGRTTLHQCVSTTKPKGNLRAGWKNLGDRNSYMDTHKTISHPSRTGKGFVERKHVRMSWGQPRNFAERLPWAGSNAARHREIQISLLIIQPLA
jgi:hypothetical protein